MGHTRFLTIAAAILLLSPAAIPQTGHFPTPPQSMDPEQQPKEKTPSLSRHVDFAQVQREADELSRTAQTIPSDVGSLRQGMLPKDVIAKLKQIEKLSKHLRSELAQ